MNASEIREMSPDEREVHLRELYEELFKLKFQKTIGQLDNPSRIRTIRREIARMLTINKELELESARKIEQGAVG